MNSKVPNILIIDDLALNIEIIEEFLEEDNYLLSSAENGETAWQMLLAEPKRFDVILLDWMMPKMNGLELLSLINQHETLKQCPVILQTAMTNREEVMEGMKTGTYYYLSKPFNEETLRTIVYAALRERQNFKDLRRDLQKSIPTPRLKNFAKFYFQNPEQIRHIASLLANLCPIPENVVLGLWELMVNAVEYGLLEINNQQKSILSKREIWVNEIESRLSSSENRNKFATIEYQRNSESIEFTIRDQGNGFDWKPYMQMSWERADDSHGRGIAKAGRVGFSHIEYRGCGNEVTATVDSPLIETTMA